jgi:hypothetical protein
MRRRQPTATIDISKIMESGTPSSLTSGMGDEPTRLLGALLVSSFSQAAEACPEIPEDERRDYILCWALSLSRVHLEGSCRHSRNERRARGLRQRVTPHERASRHEIR